MTTEYPEITILREVDPYIGLYILLGIIAIFFLILFLVGFAQFINEFTKELRYLNCEIDRTDGKERERYIRKRRRLWLSLIPFIKY